jgi:homoserine dehydrogenase
MPQPIIALKLGGSVLASEPALALAAHEIYRWLRDGFRVVAIVSAIGETTDTLINKARAYSPTPDPTALAALLATGESASAALLALALDRAGVPAAVLDVPSIRLVAAGPTLDADPISVDASAIHAALAKSPVVVIPGFLARSPEGTPVTLGRGGSDLSALFIAQRIGAERVRLLKDVPGLFERDPALPGLPPRLFTRLTFDDALALDGRIVQHKAIRFAKAHGLTFEVAALNATSATTVGPAPRPATSQGGTPPPRVELVEPPTPAAPLRVAILGLGTVGLGVLHALQQLPRTFTTTLALVRSRRQYIDLGLPPALLTTDPRTIVDSDADVVVEALGGQEPARELLRAALAKGKHAVTANKALIATHGDELTAIAQAAGKGRRLLYSAAVGGGLPVLESLAALRARAVRPARIRAILNGTTNFILGRLATGESFTVALRAAQAAGFAEADPTLDLDGTDAAHKALLIAKAAFPNAQTPPLASIERHGIANLTPDDLRTAAARGRTIRLVATIERTNPADEASPLSISVRPEPLPFDHPLASAKDEENRVHVAIEGTTQSLLIRGRGAGRWPTTQSVLGDLLELARDHALRPATTSAISTPAPAIPAPTTFPAAFNIGSLS